MDPPLAVWWYELADTIEEEMRAGKEKVLFLADSLTTLV